MIRISRFLRGLPALVVLSLAIGLSFPPRSAQAHEFVVELRATGAEREAILTDALRGFLVATAERDGHADETSNGHLGGLDVYIVPRPAGVAARFPDLRDAPSDRPDITLVIGPPDEVAAEVEAIGDETLAVPQGALDPANRWNVAEDQDPAGFAARYVAAFGQPPSRWSAQGYNAARRIDAAIRPLGGVDDGAALHRALADSAQGLRW